MNHGWFGYQGANRPRCESISWKVRIPEQNHPRSGHESRMVRIPGVEPSAVEVDFMDGAESRAEPYTLEVDFMDGAESRAEPSTLRA